MLLSDLLVVREGVETYGDQVRWVPTDHMLVDCLTKAMHPSLLNRYMPDYLYILKRQFAPVSSLCAVRDLFSSNSQV